MTAHPDRLAGGSLYRLAHAALAAAALVAFASAAAGQAWVPQAGVGSVTFLLQHTDHTGHFLADGSMLRGYDSVGKGAFLELDYAITDRCSITATGAYIGAKYLGPEPSFFGLELDECHCWNTGWQDGAVTARYNILNGAFAITPSISYGAPLANYTYQGEAVIGRNLDELRLAIDAGVRLDAISEKLSVSGQYAYAFVEKVIDLDLDRSNLLVSVAYQFHPRFSGSLDFYWQRTHGGLRSDQFVTDEQWAEYDRLVKDNSFHVGVTLAYSFTGLDVYASYVDFVDGTDTHDGRAISVGVGFPFQL